MVRIDISVSKMFAYVVPPFFMPFLDVFITITSHMTTALKKLVVGVHLMQLQFSRTFLTYVTILVT